MQFIKDKNNADENNLYQSDLVKMVFEIPYMPKEMRDKFKFDEESYNQILQDQKNQRYTER